MQAETQSETLPQRPLDNGQSARARWIAAVEQVISDAESWATEARWFVHRDPKTITEEDAGSYELPSLLIQAPAGRFTLEPRGRYIVGGSREGGFTLGGVGEIELSVYPSYESARIVRDDAGWHFAVQRPAPDRPWSREAFLEIAAELARKA